jgi:protein deglycase
MPKVLVPLAQGCEELEAVTIMDLLHRANVDVVSAGLDAEPVAASHGARLIPDTPLETVLQDDFDMVVLPGGLPGADHLGQDDRLVDLLKDMAGRNKWVCAICAAPRILAHAGLLDGKRATGYPGFLEQKDWPAVTCTGGAVERDGKIITSRGPGTAMDFALELIEALQGQETRNTVEDGLVRA